MMAIAWIKTFRLDKMKGAQQYQLDIEESWEFTEKDKSVRPFSFVRDLFELRKKFKEQFGSDSVQQLAIKLTLNSLYGKLGQRIGGERGKPPPTACPYYASAITAFGRRQVLELALTAPYDVVGFMTDGVISEAPLKLSKENIGKNLGQWETKIYKDGLFLQSGIYFVLEEGKNKDGSQKMTVINKARGARKETFKLPGLGNGNLSKEDRQEKMRVLMLEGVLGSWQEAVITFEDLLKY